MKEFSIFGIFSNPEFAKLFKAIIRVTFFGVVHFVLYH